MNNIKYRITSKNKKYGSSMSNKYFGMSTMQIIWSCVIALLLGMIIGFISIVEKG